MADFSVSAGLRPANPFYKVTNSLTNVVVIQQTTCSMDNGTNSGKIGTATVGGIQPQVVNLASGSYKVEMGYDVKINGANTPLTATSYVTIP